MAFSDTTYRRVVAGTLSANGSSESTFTLRADLLVHSGGTTFVGTVHLEAQTEAGEWISAQTMTEEGACTIDFAVERPLRVRFERTSGDLVYSLEAATGYLEERG